MCNRYMLSRSDLSAAFQRFDVPVQPSGLIEAEPDYRPTTLLPAVTMQGGSRALEDPRWGLLPSWAKDIKDGLRATNARAEGIEAKPTFRQAVREHRCLLPASAYFEWQDVGGKRKQPWRFTVGAKDAPGLFAFAGIWDAWKNPATGEWIRSAAMVTCAPNAVAEGIHDRMPVILPRDSEGLWLNPETPLSDALRLLTPYTAGEMHAQRWSFEKGSRDF